MYLNTISGSGNKQINPGFQSQASTRERIESPDLAIVRNNRTELLASVKWSLRHDRQKQLSDELDCYVDLLSQDGFPQYVLITNEYDPGRLVNTDGLNRRGIKINHIYHINLELLLGALNSHERVGDLRPLIDARRQRSEEDSLNDLAQQYRTHDAGTKIFTPSNAELGHTARGRYLTCERGLRTIAAGPVRFAGRSIRVGASSRESQADSGHGDVHESRSCPVSPR